ncbi:MAG: hypothetical protein RIQ68_1873, partial [Pseudomonadota bacterium]
CQSMADIDADEMQTSGVMVIPARCVVSIERLEEVGAASSCPRQGRRHSGNATCVEIVKRTKRNVKRASN